MCQSHQLSVSLDVDTQPMGETGVYVCFPQSWILHDLHRDPSGVVMLRFSQLSKSTSTSNSHYSRLCHFHKDLSAEFTKRQTNYSMIIRPEAARWYFTRSDLWLNQYWLYTSAPSAVGMSRQPFSSSELLKALKNINRPWFSVGLLILMFAAQVDGWRALLLLTSTIFVGFKGIKGRWWRPLHNKALTVDPGLVYSFDWKD